MKWYPIFYILLMAGLLSCKNSNVTKTGQDNTREIIFGEGPQAIIYKTTGNYSNHVPVIMNKEKTQIISYPSPKDITYRGELAKPTSLKRMYWLDNRGINENVAFLKYTYEEYSQLKETPSVEELLLNIIEKSPLQEMINCGKRSQYKDELNELNHIIDSGFKGCKIIVMPIMPDTLRL